MKVLGQLFKGVGASKIIVVDIHSKVGLKLFRIKSENVTAIPDLVGYFKKLNLKNPLVISPDQGGKQRARITSYNVCYTKLLRQVLKLHF